MSDLDHLQWEFLEARHWVITLEREVQEAREASLRIGAEHTFSGSGNTSAGMLRVQLAERSLNIALRKQEEAWRDYEGALKRSRVDATPVGAC